MLKLQKWMNKKRMQMKSRKGFSLAEVLIVLAIIAIILAVAMPDFAKSLFTTRVTACKEDIKTIGDAVLRYYAEVGHIPDVSDIGMLKEELTRTDMEMDGRKVGPWMKENMNTVDPWGNEFEWRDDGEGGYDICSKGSPEENQEICYNSLGRKANANS